VVCPLKRRRRLRTHPEPGDAAAVRDLVRTAFAGYVECIGKEPVPMREYYAARGPYVLRQRGRCTWAPGRGLRRELVTFAEGQAVAYELPEVRLYANEKTSVTPYDTPALTLVATVVE
jgi:hypothetical protein